ncbi:hypothetical protein GCM10022388_10910 [Flavobacterium chungnamense]|uniref:Uncharacterized protein n=1 Tax=Flavobacterium chungnamense TaxID=706182 RepID=A0ABP7ULY8_9FLAO
MLVPEKENVVEVNSREMLQNRSPLIALNFLNDKAILKNIDGVFQCNNYKTYNGLAEKVIKNRYDLKIIIDTSYSFTSKGIAFKNLLYSVNDSILSDSINKPFYKNKLPFSRISTLENKSVAAYPVLFFNNSTKKIPLGTSDLKIEIIQEAKDIDGKWKPIEFFYGDGMCFQPLNLLLEPMHYTATTIIKYKGSFKTKIRVKYFDNKNTYYSNEICGTINRSQFNQVYLLDFYRDSHNGSYPRYYEGFKKSIFLNN